MSTSVPYPRATALKEGIMERSSLGGLGDARRVLHSHRRTCHASTATPSHKADARRSAPAGDRKPDDEAESHKAETSQRGAGSIERCGFLAAPVSSETRPFFSFPDMLFDQGRACGKDRGEGEKQPADNRPEPRRYEPCDYGHRAAEQESEKIFVPAGLT